MIFCLNQFKKYLPILAVLLVNFAIAQDAKRFERELLKIDVKTAHGKDVNMSKVEAPIIVLNFWASWCRPCVAEFKSLNKFIEHIGDKKIFVLGINNDEEKALKALDKFERNYKLKFNSVLDDQVAFTDKFMVSKIPTSIIFVNKKFYKFVPERFDFMDEDFLKKIKAKANIVD